MGQGRGLSLLAPSAAATCSLCGPTAVRGLACPRLHLGCRPAAAHRPPLTQRTSVLALNSHAGCAAANRPTPGQHTQQPTVSPSMHTVWLTGSLGGWGSCWAAGAAAPARAPLPPPGGCPPAACSCSPAFCSLTAAEHRTRDRTSGRRRGAVGPWGDGAGAAETAASVQTCIVNAITSVGTGWRVPARPFGQSASRPRRHLTCRGLPPSPIANPSQYRHWRLLPPLIAAQPSGKWRCQGRA